MTLRAGSMAFRLRLCTAQKNAGMGAVGDVGRSQA
jgi:hypothetical protein